MLKRLQYKFIAITMGILLLVFAVIIVSLNIFVQESNNRQTHSLLKRIAQQDGRLQPKPARPGDEDDEQKLPRFNDKDDRTMHAMRTFYAKLDHEGNILEINHRMMYEFSDETAIAYIEAVLVRPEASGRIEQYQYLIESKDYGYFVVFAERVLENLLLERLVQISLLVVTASMTVLLLLVYFLSRWAVQPVKQTLESQRQFISDASHELRTPLTIISANLDVLDNEIGPYNKNLNSIKGQTERMSALIHDLLTLAKADEGNAQLTLSDFDLSQLVLRTTLELESCIFEAEKKLACDIQDGIWMHGNEPQMHQLVAILIDNAIKHSDKNGTITVKLDTDGSKSRLCVANTGSSIPKEEREKIFQRFYRSDASRSRETGGYGLGLAIADSIIKAHKGKIIISDEQEKGVCFTVIFNTMLKSTAL